MQSIDKPPKSLTSLGGNDISIDSGRLTGIALKTDGSKESPLDYDQIR